MSSSDSIPYSDISDEGRSDSVCGGEDSVEKIASMENDLAVVGATVDDRGGRTKGFEYRDS